MAGYKYLYRIMVPENVVMMEQKESTKKKPNENNIKKENGEENEWKENW